MYKERILPNEQISECAGPSELLPLNLALEDSWILHQCAETVKQANQDLESYNFHLAVRAMKNFVKGRIILTLYYHFLNFQRTKNILPKSSKLGWGDWGCFITFKLRYVIAG